MIADHFARITVYGQLVAMFLFTTIGLALLVATGLAFAGVLPWLELPVAYGGAPIEWGGQAFQIGATVFFLLLAVYVPSNRHVMMLEASHRAFAISMDDITRAYTAAHLADRREVFRMEREFDAIRERFEFLRAHPDLPEIDGELLTIAAQMSEQSRDLANAFSEEKVSRARNSLVERRKDAEELEARIQAANAVSRELRRDLDDVEFAESSVASQMRRLREELFDLEARIGLNSANRNGRHLRPVGDVVP